MKSSVVFIFYFFMYPDLCVEHHSPVNPGHNPKKERERLSDEGGGVLLHLLVRRDEGSGRDD